MLEVCGATTQDFDNNFGAILRFDISTLPGAFKDIFATTVGAADCSQFLHRPEGITWGPAKGLYKEKLLYVTGYTDSQLSTPPVNNTASLLKSLPSSGTHLHRLCPPHTQLSAGLTIVRVFSSQVTPLMSMRNVRQARLAFPGVSTTPCNLCFSSLTAKRPAYWEGLVALFKSDTWSALAGPRCK